MMFNRSQTNDSNNWHLTWKELFECLQCRNREASQATPLFLPNFGVFGRLGQLVTPPTESSVSAKVSSFPFPSIGTSNNSYWLRDGQLSC